MNAVRRIVEDASGEIRGNHPNRGWKLVMYLPLLLPASFLLKIIDKIMPTSVGLCSLQVMQIPWLQRVLISLGARFLASSLPHFIGNLVTTWALKAIKSRAVSELGSWRPWSSVLANPFLAGNKGFIQCLNCFEIVDDYFSVPTQQQVI
jgi:hypothetical protein